MEREPKEQKKTATEVFVDPPDNDQQEDLADDVQTQQLSPILGPSLAQILHDLADDERREERRAELLRHMLVNRRQAISTGRFGQDEAPAVTLLQVHGKEERGDEGAWASVKSVTVSMRSV